MKAFLSKGLFFVCSLIFDIPYMFLEIALIKNPAPEKSFTIVGINETC